MISILSNYIVCKYIKFTIIYDIEKLQILTFEKLEPKEGLTFLSYKWLKQWWDYQNSCIFSNDKWLFFHIM